MKLYKVFGGIAFICLIVGTASICGAIEMRTTLRIPVLILLFGCVCMYIAIRESGGWLEIEEDNWIGIEMKDSRERMEDVRRDWHYEDF